MILSLGYNRSCSSSQRVSTSPILRCSSREKKCIRARLRCSTPSLLLRNVEGNRNVKMGGPMLPPHAVLRKRATDAVGKHSQIRPLQCEMEAFATSIRFIVCSSSRPGRMHCGCTAHELAATLERILFALWYESAWSHVAKEAVEY